MSTRNADAYSQIVNRFGLGPYCWQVCGWVNSAICYEFCICVCPNPTNLPWFTHVGYFDITSDIDSTSGKTNKSLSFPSLSYGGGPNFAFYGALQLGGFCPVDSPTSPGTQMKYRFLYDNGSGPQPINASLVSPALVGTRQINWPVKMAGNIAGGMSTIPWAFQDIVVQAVASDPTPPVSGSMWYGPSARNIAPDANGWVDVDPAAMGSGFGFPALLAFDSTDVVPGGVPPLPADELYNPNPGVPAGTAVPVGNQRAGTALSITFEATRQTTFPPGTTADYSNSLSKILVNNYAEVNELNFAEFSTGCCTPIDKTLSVEFTVDHEEMSDGTWSLGIVSCALPSLNITPSVSGPGVTVTSRGGSGTIVEDTSLWPNCSYTAGLFTKPGLTTGLTDYLGTPDTLTFAICNHNNTTLSASITATQTSITVTDSAGFPATPFNALIASTGEIVTVNNVAGNTWTVSRGQAGTTAAAAAAGATVSAN